MHLQQAVGPHEPDKPGVRVHSPERLDGIDGVIRAYITLQAADYDPGIGSGLFGGGPAIPIRRHAGDGFEGVLGCHQPPDPVEIQKIERPAADVQMAGVSRIEGTAEKADTFTVSRF